MELYTNVKNDTRPFLLFSSVGRFAETASWLGGNRNFDVWITDYHSDANPHAELVEYLNYRKGGKWPNLHAAYGEFQAIFEQYRAIWVVDDDLKLSPRMINKLFNYFEKYQLLAAQPSFDARGRNGMMIAEEHPLYKLRYTNFVETGSPVIRLQLLKSFMEVYDPALVGYGTDWLLMHHIGDRIQGKVAIIDEIRCYNPHPSTKGGTREIDRLQSRESRIRKFEEIKELRNITIDESGPKVLGRIYQKNPAIVIFHLIRKHFLDKISSRLKRLLGQFK